MLTTNLQSSPYLPRQRNFPNESPQALGVMIDKTYIEIASRVNERTIGLFAVNFSIITGDRWFFSGSSNSQQSLRQVYTFSGAGSIPHGLNWASISQISPKTYGSFTDGTNWYGAIYASVNPIAGQVSFYITPTNIVILAGAAITSGIIVLEYLTAVQNNSP